MASDRGVSPDLGDAELEPGWFGGCDWLYVSGYSLFATPIAGASLTACRLARAADRRLRGAGTTLPLAWHTDIDG